MSEAVSKARQMAEIAFDKTQSQFLARTRAFEEHDTVTAERAEKTQRLRAARLEREQSGVQPPGAANQKKTAVFPDAIFTIPIKTRRNAQ